MKCQIRFSVKSKKKKYFKMSSAENLPRVLSLKKKKKEKIFVICYIQIIKVSVPDYSG